MRGRLIRALTLVRLRGAAHERGTQFEVVDKPDPASGVLQVDSTTARLWLREGWAVPVAAGKPKK